MRALLAPLAALGVLLARSAAAADAAPPAGEGSGGEERAAVHYQATVATQWHPSFPARYTGTNSLRPESESATSVVTDLFLGARLWSGAEAHFQPELAGGRGLSSTLGVAAFPSGEVYRVGDPTPTVLTARLFLRQVIGLGGGEAKVEPGPSQLGGRRDRDAVTFTLGKVATTDFVDSIPSSSDPHARFTSWGLWASAAYDYPADVRGYTWGAAVDLTLGDASVRGGLFLEPTVANGAVLDWRIDRSRGLVLEGELRIAPGGRPGAVRVLGFLNQAPMGSYRLAVEDPSARLDVAATRAPGRQKYGFAASVNQELGGDLGVFARVSWDDGATESWAFTEIDRSVAAGAVQGGGRWGRPLDEAGLSLVVSGLSEPHRAYLAAGGHGFLIGDGALRYGPEILAELFYRLALGREISFIGTYQPIVNPAFNRDRGPAHVFTGRVHVEL
jgi:high affinity Mn2+ porin